MTDVIATDPSATSAPESETDETVENEDGDQSEAQSTGDPSALAMVQKDPPSEGGESVLSSGTLWKWTRVKRKAIKLILQGRSNVQIAKELGKHRHTIRRWKETDEFRAETLRQAHEYANQKRFKRVYETGAMTDSVARHAVKTLTKLEKNRKVSGAEFSRALSFLREYRAFRAEERQDFGDNVQRMEVGGGFTVGITGESGAPKTVTGEQSFKDFLQKSAASMPKRVIQGVTTPAEALVAVTREALKNTDVLDKLHEEDDAHMAAEEKNRKR